MSNLIRLPSAVNSLAPLSAAVDHLRGVVADAARAARGAPSFDLAAAEQAVYAALQRIEAAALAEIVSATEPESDVIEVDGVRYRRMTSASRGVSPLSTARSRSCGTCTARLASAMAPRWTP